MAALLSRLVELGYGVAYRTLDARYFGVPQRRRRVFILSLRSEGDDPDGRAAAERAAEILSVGARCPGHPASGREARSSAADGVGAGIGRALSTNIVGNAVRAGGHGDPGIGRDGDEWRLVVGPSPDPDRVRAADGLAGRLDDRGGVAAFNPYRTLNRGRPDDNEARAGHLVIGDGVSDDLLLPPGLDSHRYRCCGNGVVSNVAEWIGWRLRIAA